MLRRFYTVMIVPHEGGALKRLSVSMNFIISMVGLFLFCFVSSAFLAHVFLGSLHGTASDEKARMQNARDQVEIARLRADLQTTLVKLDQQIDNLEKLKLSEPKWSDSESAAMGGGLEFETLERSGLFTTDGDIRATTRSSWDKADYWTQDVEEWLCERNSAPTLEPMDIAFWPVRGVVRRTSGFGPRRDPFDGSREFHEGVDIAAPSGAEVVAIEDGVVIEARRHGGYGNMVLIEHGNGRQTLYGHLRRFTVKAGQVVRRDDVIGAVGSTGRSTGPHLHFEVIVEGKPVDPSDHYPVFG